MYIREPESPVFLALAEQGSIRTSLLGFFETLLAIRRQAAEQRIDSTTADWLADELALDVSSGTITIIAETLDLRGEFEHVVETCLHQSPPIWIRTFDALHVAAALLPGETEFISNDTRQRAAAQAVGLSVRP